MNAKFVTLQRQIKHQINIYYVRPLYFEGLNKFAFFFVYNFTGYYTFKTLMIINVMVLAQ